MPKADEPVEEKHVEETPDLPGEPTTLVEPEPTPQEDEDPNRYPQEGDPIGGGPTYRRKGP